MPQAVAEVEGGSHPDPSSRVRVFTVEIPDGSWGGFGRVVRLPDIAEHVLGPDIRLPAEQ